MRIAISTRETYSCARSLIGARTRQYDTEGLRSTLKIPSTSSTEHPHSWAFKLSAKALMRGAESRFKIYRKLWSIRCTSRCSKRGSSTSVSNGFEIESLKTRHPCSLMDRRSGKYLTLGNIDKDSGAPQYQLEVDVSISVCKEGNHECRMVMVKSWRERYRRRGALPVHSNERRRFLVSQRVQ